MTISDKKNRSLCIAKYINTVRQANERTAVEYQYRLSKFEKYLVVVSREQQQQQQNQGLITLDYVVEDLKRNNNTKIDPYDLLSGFVVYLLQERNIRNPNTIRHFVITARNFLEYHDIEIRPRKFKLRVRLPQAVIWNSIYGAVPGIMKLTGQVNMLYVVHLAIQEMTEFSTPQF